VRLVKTQKLIAVPLTGSELKSMKSVTAHFVLNIWDRELATRSINSNPGSSV
jgi:hypothetical protein